VLQKRPKHRFILKQTLALIACYQSLMETLSQSNQPLMNNPACIVVLWVVLSAWATFAASGAEGVKLIDLSWVLYHYLVCFGTFEVKYG